MTTSARPTGHPGYTETLPCEAAGVAAARRFVRTAFSVWRLDYLADDGALIVSELMTNSVQHTECRNVRVIVTLPAPDRVRVAVVDTSRVLPARRSASDMDTDGRGLAIVEALADRSGVDLLRWGKRAWAELCTDSGQ
ncbi:ATP-binding protein [Streptomyces sp. NPDC047000]|uniref:ATP-binding protein n=1 Tax=Streptomyces sp. NPDC047000 TaxID=3155474 RepID=UPI00340E030B